MVTHDDSYSSAFESKGNNLADVSLCNFIVFCPDQCFTNCYETILLVVLEFRVYNTIIRIDTVFFFQSALHRSILLCNA